MSKKTIALVVTGLAALTMAVPTFASWGGSSYCRYCRDEEITEVVSSSVAVADTGLNHTDDSAGVVNSLFSGASADSKGDRTIRTGDAYAGSDSFVVIAGDDQGCGDSFCGDGMGGESGLETEVVRVTSGSSASAYTGGNSANNTASVVESGFSFADAGSRGGRTINTGNADAESSSWVIIGASILPL